MVNVFVRHAKRSGPSGRKIAEVLRSYLPLHNIEAGRVVRYQNPDVIINWGGGTTIPVYDSVIFNQPANIMLSSDKISAFRKLEEAGISVPYWDDISLWRNGFPQTWSNTGFDIRFPVLVRKRYGKRGLGIEYCESYLQVMRFLHTHDFVSEFIEKKYEFRVHVAFGEAVKLSQKVFDPTKGKRYQNRVWNHKRGFVFKNPRDNVSPDLLERVKQFGIASIEAVGLDFGAVDIICNEDEVIFVLETNTAPGLIQSTAVAYAMKFAQVINRS